MLRRILSYILIALTIISGILTVIFVTNNVVLGSSILLIGVVAAILASTYKKWILYLRPIQFLRNRDDVYRAADKILRENRNITFCGKLDVIFIEKLLNRFNEGLRESNKFSQLIIDIYNCDPFFYYGNVHLDKLKEVLDIDSKYFNFNHKFYLYNQNINFIRGEAGEKDSLIIFYQSLPNDYNGVYIRKGTRFKIEDVITKKAAPSINIMGQLDNIRSVAKKSLDFWEPLQKGWFYPVFPPDNVADIRRIWRKCLLEWFNSTALSLLKKGGKLTISWRIEEWSEKDAEAFREWLNCLKELTKRNNIEVTRYMLISIRNYIINENYKEVVDHILQTYLPTPLPRSSGDPYQIYFVDSDGLPDILNDDFSIFYIKEGEGIAQTSLKDTKANVEVIRVIFSKDFDVVRDVNHKLNRIASYNPKTKLQDLLPPN